jgi:ATP-dependent helicase HrpA
VFRDERSDFLTLLKLWDQYQHAADTLGGGALAGWCREHFLSGARMREWGELVRQLRSVADELELRDAGGHTRPLEDRIHRALLTGLISNVACREGDGSFDYRGVRGNVVQIFPGSVLFRKGPKWIMAAEVVQTTRLYARTVARIDPEWIEELAGHMFRHQVSDPHLDPQTGEPSAWERVTMSGIVVVPRRRATLVPLDAPAARKLFIREALAACAWQTDAPFMRNNRAVLDEARGLEAKLRRRDVLAPAEHVAAWFEARVPATVCDPATFDRWSATWGDDRGPVWLTLPDVLRADARADVAQFPDSLLFGSDAPHAAPLAYIFAQGKPDDGVTATLTLLDLPRLSPQRAAWLVPGMLPQVVLGLLKLLPKGQRAEVERMGSVEEVAAACAGVMEFSKGRLEEALSEAVSVLYAVSIAPSAWAAQGLPAHLRLRVRVIDDAGNELAEGRDVAELHHRLEARVRKALAAAAKASTERHAIATWDFGPLPTPEEGDTSPALIDKGDSVSLSRIAGGRQAAAHTQLGLRRLFALAVREEAVYYVEALPRWEEMGRWYSQLGTPAELREQVIAVTAGRVFMEGQAPVTTREQFEARLLEGSGRLAVATREVGESIGKTLEARALVARRLSGGTPRIWAESVADIREHAAYLLARGFMHNLWWERLRHYPRYVGTLWERLLAMREEGRDANLAPLKVIVPHWKRYTGWVAAAMSSGRDAVVEECPKGKGKPALPQARRAAPTVNTDAGEWAMRPGQLPPQVEQFRWAVEELRVALLAPQLQTGPAPTGADLDRLWAAVAAMPGAPR